MTASSGIATPSDAALTQAEWLPVLFAERPTRANLLSLTPSWSLRHVRGRIHRNVAIEFITSIAAPYLALAGIAVDWSYSDYDDSLALKTAGDADVEVIWLDYARFAVDASMLESWLEQRLGYLRTCTRAPILINADPRPSLEAAALNERLTSAAARVPGVYVCDPGPLARELGPAFFDERNRRVVGLPYSNAAAVLVARELGARWLPSVLVPALKAIVVDLDHTLYSGVLGEDGVAGIVIGPGHVRLQRQLLAYHGEGIFLGICSKNEPEDVWNLIASRPDLELRREQLSAYAIGWQSKASGLRRIAADLRIGLDAILYIDDNPGELAAISSEIPDIRVLHAGADPFVTARALGSFPGLHRWTVDDTDQRRIADLAAAAVRSAAARHSADGRAYMQSLQVRVGFRINARADIERLASLSAKTNQFNLRLRRLTPADVSAYVTGAHSRAVAVSLADRLSDSGVIGAIFFRLDRDLCVVDEVCVSCRALGRDLEDLLILGALQAGFPPGFLPERIEFSYSSGPRNGPARQWLENLAGVPLAQEGVVTLSWSECVKRFAPIESLLEPGSLLISYD